MTGRYILTSQPPHSHVFSTVTRDVSSPLTNFNYFSYIITLRKYHQKYLTVFVICLEAMVNQRYLLTRDLELEDGIGITNHVKEHNYLGIMMTNAENREAEINNRINKGRAAI